MPDDTTLPADAPAPWDTVDDELPRRITPEWITDILATNHGWDILRTHLTPQHKGEPYQASWRALWRTLAFDGRWRARVTRRLRADQQIAHDALTGNRLDPDEQARARRFIRAADDAINRLGNEADQAMAWAGAKYARHPPVIRELLETLVVAIDDHRAGLIGDDELHGVLETLGIDPRQRGISEAAVERARAKYRGNRRR
ncbi:MULTISPECIES: hypothetical protein [Mycobacterium]|uniref:Uncharacterized protein n=4 Tax=Mycobacterium TaxID=1763 RepID=A0AAW5S3C7_MYCBC|nr:MULTISPECIES: hypothetical protein [Mycobacterium]KMV14420.1 hypothetical protein ACT16_23475 [Mycobacterium heckeshornense]MCV6989764.1 hypothetical protein [Mycobacterium bouchedurhonense]MCV6996704.1 hypothetical protein [Mycobacterium timonense]MDA3642114.1 hypothetical protein [Mycobacterium xenopi]MDA3659999.1 hypothetical protein [Mycobacterium xenopi]